jgi:hypothetical protein
LTENGAKLWVNFNPATLITLDTGWTAFGCVMLFVAFGDLALMVISVTRGAIFFTPLNSIASGSLFDVALTTLTKSPCLASSRVTEA